MNQQGHKHTSHLRSISRLIPTVKHRNILFIWSHDSDIIVYTPFADNASLGPSESVTTSWLPSQHSFFNIHKLNDLKETGVIFSLTVYLHRKERKVYLRDVLRVNSGLLVGVEDNTCQNLAAARESGRRLYMLEVMYIRWVLGRIWKQLTRLAISSVVHTNVFCWCSGEKKTDTRYL